jgi:hypothetical protein
MSDDDVHFFRNLKPISDFSLITDSRLHVDIPESWFVVITDVVGSTDEVQGGRYKDVNMVGAACIAAVSNINRGIDVPYVFGGDGASFAICSTLVNEALSVLKGVAELSLKVFDLQLRVGKVSVGALQTQGHFVKCAKYQLSKDVSLAAFSGRGWDVAEKLIKNTDPQNTYLLDRNTPSKEPDLSGLECRWNEIPSKHDCKLSIILQCLDPDSERHGSIYNAVLGELTRAIGPLDGQHPIDANQMSLAWNPHKLWREAKLRSAPGDRLRYLCHLVPRLMVGWFLMRFKIDTRDVRWSKYLEDFLSNSDYRKYDGSLKMVLDLTLKSRDLALTILDRFERENVIVYGVHQSPSAIVTCLVTSYNGAHSHFVDGSQGGYAMAAKELKQKLKMRLASKESLS